MLHPIEGARRAPDAKDEGAAGTRRPPPRSAEPRPLSRRERIADAWVHWLAIIVAAPAVLVLMAVAVPQDRPALTLGLLIYGLSLLAMLVSSALYNRAAASNAKDLLRRIDHAVIFVMIAGTYTPFLALKMPDTWGQWLLVYVWVLAGLGVLL
ncbi:MAG TPA: hemolysin III family protein, partial [Rhodospirillales bacterium]|nr:hemolysin III family protein [Rhodospirillales bacterium]